VESQAYIKNLKISPKKLRFLLPEIKKLRPSEALEKLFYIPKKSAKIFYQAIKSAVSNAKTTLKTGEEMLKFKLLTIEEGRKLKRFQPGARGMVKPILKRYAHIRIVLEAEKPQVTIKSEIQNPKSLPRRQAGETIPKIKYSKSKKNGTKS